jgi:hypothetical protein
MPPTALILKWVIHRERGQRRREKRCPCDSLIRLRILLLYQNDLAFRALLDQAVDRFGKKPLDHPD